MVPRGVRVADGLIGCDLVRDLRERRLAVDVEAVIGRSLADALRRLDASEELGHVLLVQGLAVLVVRVHVDHERGPVRTCEQRDRRACTDERHPGLERPVQKEVLLVVHDPGAHIVGCDRARSEGDRLPPPERPRTPAPPRTSSVASAYARSASAVTCVPMLVGSDGRVASRSKLIRVIPVIWPPLTVKHLAVNEVRPRRAEEEDRAGSLLRRPGPAERDDRRGQLAHLRRDAERDLVPALLDRRAVLGRTRSAGSR